MVKQKDTLKKKKLKLLQKAFLSKITVTPALASDKR